MCLRAQGIDDGDDIVDRLRRSHGLGNDNGGVGRGRGIHDASEVLETITEAYRIQVQRRSLWHRDDGPDELATTILI